MRVFCFDSNDAMMHLLSNGFRDAGHEVLVIGADNLDAVVNSLELFKPELVITNGWGLEQTVENQIWIKNYVKPRNIPHVYWSIEDPSFTSTFVLPLIQRTEPDYVFTLTAPIVDYYRSLGIKAAHLDWGYQPSIHHPVPPIPEYNFNIALVANSYEWVFDTWNIDYRIESMKQLICPLIENNVRIDIFGKGWEKINPYIDMEINPDWIHGTVPYLDCKKIYSSAKIVIGLQNFTTQVTQRTYEILAAGGFLLTSDTPAVRQLFLPGRDLVVSSSPYETLNLVHYYLQNEWERKQISSLGTVAVQPHTYKARAEYILNVLKAEGILPAI
ncbi:glycosyltransferase [Heyndrickxia sp. FSL K6-6286]|uniref:CgeB family protein n=1 Tax=Heyndrickxia sp. FSL K6-6286 TaxID=2921510 RepID=UPI00315AA7AC